MRERATRVLLDAEVPLGERRDLRQVGDAQDLAPLGQRAQLAADRARRLAADARVDLVEDERCRALALARDAHECEHRARELAARGGLAQRSRRHARVRCDAELDALVPGRGPSLPELELYGEVGALHAELAELGPHRLGESRGTRRPARAEPARVLVLVLALVAQPALEVLADLVGVLERRELRAAALAVREHSVDAATVLAREAVVALEALLDPAEPPRLLLQLLDVAAQLSSKVLGLDAERAQALGERVEARVDTRDRVGRSLALGERAAQVATLAGVGGERLRPAHRRLPQRVDAAQPPALLAQVVLLSCGGLERLDLGQLVGEQVTLALARSRARPQVLELALERARAPEDLTQLAARRQVLGAAEGVKHL